MRRKEERKLINQMEGERIWKEERGEITSEDGGEKREKGRKGG